jgi:hypothetical protein
MWILRYTCKELQMTYLQKRAVTKKAPQKTEIHVSDRFSFNQCLFNTTVTIATIATNATIERIAYVKMEGSFAFVACKVLSIVGFGVSDIGVAAGLE